MIGSLIKEKTKRPLYKTFLNIAGYLLVLLSFIFIIRSFLKIDLSILKNIIDLTWIPWSILMVVIYAFCYVLYSIAWKYIIESYSSKKLDNALVMNIYMRSNVAKYIPGNIFHFAGRHYLVRKEGISDKALLFGNMTEIASLIFYSSLIILIGFASGCINIPESVLTKIKTVYLLIGASIFAAAVILFFIIIKLRKKKINWKFFLSVSNLPLIIKNSFLYTFIFIVLGSILYVITFILLKNSFSFDNMLYVICSFSLAWVLGFIVPGAPGGLGIRETVIIIMLGSIYDNNTSVLSSVIMRIITISGDILAYLIGYFIGRIKRLEIK
jgi:glycosyltransferase 2 family protein